MNEKQKENASACPGCGAFFVCGVEAGQSTCWCMEKPTVFFEPEAAGRCYCPACLDKRVSEQSALAT